ncbi:MAG TPA: DUF1343 domain-containing protein [Pyrinomonadaceae bacterium]|nr:DUF1343 domain-containing protein [Pyrinomonadaceae bacterium]
MDTDKKVIRRFRLGQRYLQYVIFFVFICVYLCSSVDKTLAQGLPVAAPQTVGMNAAKLDQIDALVAADIAAKKLPGAVVVVGHKGKIVFRKAYGNRSLVPNVEKMTVDTIFDVASLTKPIATATSIMILVEQGNLRLNDTIGKFIHDIDDENAKRVTIQQLLTHTSGYAPDFDLREKWTGRDGMLAALKKEKLKTAPGTKFVYSDIGFIVLGEIVHRLSNRFSFEFFGNAISLPSNLVDSRFFATWADSVGKITPPIAFDTLLVFSKLEKRIAPTENIRGQNNYLGSKFEGDEKTGSEILRGRVHDPTAYRMGGEAGHAGLFSTADDLARYCQMMLNGGTLDGKRVMSAQTVAKMTAPIVVSEDGATRGLGWDINTAFSSNRGELFPLGSFGHTGFTGTSVWIDRVSQTFVVFLSNRVHPDGKGDVTPLRAKIATVVASAIEDTPVEVYRLAESTYNSAVAAQMPKFVSGQQSAVSSQQFIGNQIVKLPTPPGQLPPLDGMRPYGRLGSVLNGIDILARDKFKQLEGLKIGLVTNQTGRNLAGKQTIDILKEAPNVKLVALFSPEHGIRGLVDDKVSDSVDEKTGLPIYSLYGETRRPKPEQLKDLDAIVYDIQDIGTRFYTYTATLKNVLEEAAKAGKPVFILDRPNPIGGTDVEGPLADEDRLSFIAAHTIPVRYGMTIGELGMMMNTERKIGADLRVIKMENWSRAMWFDETGQTWINPSPNMRSLTEATLYPGIGLLEASNLSVGRGTDTPFEVIGAPWLDGQKLAKYLNERGIKGVRFVPIRFKPNASVFKDEQLSGVNIIITNRDEFNSVRTGVEIAVALRKLYPTEWNVDKYLNLLLNKDIFEWVKRGDTPEEIEGAAKAGVDDFLKRRTPFLLYK